MLLGRRMRRSSHVITCRGGILAYRVSPAIRSLIEAKTRWSVALSALIRRYCDLGLMNEDRTRWIYIEMSRKGFLRKEPCPMQREGSSIWMQVPQTLWQERRS